MLIYGLLALRVVEQLTMKANSVILSELAMLDLSPANCAKSAGALRMWGMKVLMQSFIFKAVFLFAEPCARGNCKSMRPLGYLG